jgi:arginine N-succinyltransferase
MPTHPLYVSLLTPQAVQAIGETHPQTGPALNMLLKQGFQKTGEIDLYDGGPRVAALRDQIVIIQNAQQGIVNRASSMQSSHLAIVAKPSLQFLAALSSIAVEENRVTLDQQTAKTLEISPNEKVFYALL